MPNRHATIILSLLTLFVGSGATCNKFTRAPATNPAPVAFYGTPTLEQVVRVINSNTSRVQQLQSTSGKLSVAGLPALQANLALERPQRFRLQAGFGLTGGTELDLGSNDELFWFWAKRNDPEAVYYARHAEFHGGTANEVLPLPPQWLITTLGLIELQPTSQVSGPFVKQAGQLEIQTVESGVSGPLRRTLVLDDQRGHILEQHVHDANGVVLAVARAADFEYDAASGAAIPKRVAIELPPAQLAFTLEMDGYRINQLYADGAQLWSMPTLNGYPYVDLMRMPPNMGSSATPNAPPSVRQQSPSANPWQPTMWHQ